MKRIEINWFAYWVKLSIELVSDLTDPNLRVKLFKRADWIDYSTIYCHLYRKVYTEYRYNE